MHDKEVHWKELSFRVFCGFGSKFGFSPELRLFSHPEQLIQSEFSGNADSKKCNSSLFLPSTPDSRSCDKAQTHNSPTKPYKLRFRGVILFRINFVFGYYTYTKASSKNRGQVIPILQSLYLFLVCFGLVHAYKKLRYIQIQEDDKIKQNFDGNKRQMGQVILIPLAFFMILFMCA